MKLTGLPIDLGAYDASQELANRNFPQFKNQPAGVYLPLSMQSFMNVSPIQTRRFIEDDNRGAVMDSPYTQINGTDFYLSVKGIGSTMHPFSHRPFSKAEISGFLADPKLRERVLKSNSSSRYITGEVMLRGSPYGGQGLEHAITALRASELAGEDPTSIHGFRIAPLIKITALPRELESQVRQIYWYRQFEKRIVQEIRLVPSNVRIYFHSGATVGGNVGAIFDMFGIDTNDKALEFEKNFVKSGIAFMTLFVRSMRWLPKDEVWSGLDLYDVWLDKDAVLSKEGTIYFVDLEGIERITIKDIDVKEKIFDQIYRSLYEFTYAYYQLEMARAGKFGRIDDRKLRFEHLLREALVDDEVIRLEHDEERAQVVIGNILGRQDLEQKFTMLDIIRKI